MTFIRIEYCKDRDAAQARKVEIKSGDPDTDYNTRIIENIQSLAVYLTPDSDSPPLSPHCSATGIGDELEGAVLIIWTA